MRSLLVLLAVLIAASTASAGDFVPRTPKAEPAQTAAAKPVASATKSRPAARRWVKAKPVAKKKPKRTSSRNEKRPLP